jgi:hypothetical protein
MDWEGLLVEVAYAMFLSESLEVSVDRYSFDVLVELLVESWRLNRSGSFEGDCGRCLARVRDVMESRLRGFRLPRRCCLVEGCAWWFCLRFLV